MKQKDGIIQRLNVQIDALKALRLGDPKDSDHDEMKRTEKEEESTERVRAQNEEIEALRNELETLRQSQNDNVIEGLKAENESLRRKVEELEAVIADLKTTKQSPSDTLKTKVRFTIF